MKLGMVGLGRMGGNMAERLRAHGIPTTVRDTRGSDIDGACGQLAAGQVPNA